MADRSVTSRVTGAIHGGLVHSRRIQVLARLLGEAIPPGMRVLDIGCGDGSVGHEIENLARNVSVTGLEVMERPTCKIPHQVFDGEHIPLDDNSVDLAMMVDVLHHTNDVSVLLNEAGRVAGKHVLIKDHLCENAPDRATLRFMDWVGNRPHGVALPYNYLSRAEWIAQFSKTGLEVARLDTRVPLYNFPFDRVFGRELHFIALLNTGSDHS